MVLIQDQLMELNLLQALLLKDLYLDLTLLRLRLILLLVLLQRLLHLDLELLLRLSLSPSLLLLSWWLLAPLLLSQPNILALDQRMLKRLKLLL